MVAAGELAAHDDRAVVESDRLIMDVSNEIGVYGGTWRFSLGGWTLDYGQWSPSYCTNFDVDMGAQPYMCKSVEPNDTGTVWTFTLREGMRWWHMNPDSGVDAVNGDLVSMEDVKFAWIDLAYDVLKTDAAWRDRFPGVYKKGGGRRNQFTDRITGELAAFAVVDDTHFTLSFDNPQWTLAQTLEFAGGTRCEYFAIICNKKYFEPYHPEYADPDALEALIEDGDYGSWVDLLNHRASIFSTYQGAVPWLGESILQRGGIEIGANEAYTTGSPMHWAYDPVGNQLPYYDHYHVVRYDSQEVATFRSMAGETDMGKFGYAMSELPMYQANMVEGDFSIYGWSGVGGKGVFGMGQTYNEDPEIGRWIRDDAFRQALSYAIDRDAHNQVNWMGAGTIASFSYGPNSAWYTGDEYAMKWTEYDPAKANELLDALGLVDTDGDGWRNRTGVLGGGTGNIEFFGHTPASLLFASVRTANPALIIQEDLAAVGIKFDFKADSNWSTFLANSSEYLAITSGAPWRPEYIFPQTCGEYRAARLGCWFVGRSSAGGTDTQYPPMEKGLADSNWLPIAPGTSWAADGDGRWEDLWASWQVTTAYPRNDPRSIEAGRDMMKTMIDQQQMLSTVNFVANGIVIKRNNFRNVRPHSNDGYANDSSQYYFEDGIDNANNPGNKSKRWKSESFMTGLTY
jgi:ABC-type transport system substrate-binding protein